MSFEARLGELVAGLASRDVPSLVMGGHAVRFYGVDRTTIDYDLVVSVGEDAWSGLGDAVAAMSGPGVQVAEGPSWRPSDFRRFVVGRLPDGREERLECWRRNHLLAPFSELHARRREGSYGGRRLEFLGLRDLLRSKETERESDWLDIALLEEIYDEERLRAGAIDDLRSRRGFERALAGGVIEAASAAEAWTGAAHPVTLGYLAPFVRERPAPPAVERGDAIGELLRGPLRRVEPGSIRHLALVEAVRRLCKRAAMDADRADKRRAVETLR